jgi:hypothetical protein
MKKILTLGSMALLLLLSAFYACKKDTPVVVVNNSRGYNCNNFTCTLVEENAQYVTLLDCKSECADTRPGSATLVYNQTNCGSSYTNRLSVYGSAEDVAIDAYLSTTSSSGSLALHLDDLSPGFYYYKIIATPNCFSYQNKTVRFEVSAGKDTGVEIKF